VELLAAAQGLEYLKPLQPGRGVARAYAAVRGLVAAVDGDRPLGGDIERIASSLRAGAFDPEAQ
jgi:histidine ammonia-lyase